MDDAQARRVQAWIDGHVRAWNSNDPADIGALITQDAAYSCEAYSRPWRGQDEIVRQWLARKDEPGQAQFTWHPLAVPPRSPSSRARSPIPGRATPSGGCATPSPTSQLLSPQTSRRPAPQASSARPSAEAGGVGLPGRHRTRPDLPTGGWSHEPGGVGREVLHGGPPWCRSPSPGKRSRSVCVWRIGCEG
jgi:hypothetical protein